MYHSRRQIFSAGWRLAKSYWTSEEKWVAWSLLLLIVGLNLANVYVSVQINAWNNSFYNALQSFNSAELFPQLGVFAFLATFAITFSTYALYLKQLLQVRWRQWLTHHYLHEWTRDRVYYHLHLSNGNDNPDQRIAEDLDQFTNFALSLSVGMLSSIVSLGSFLFILWQLSGSADIPLGHWGTIHIPAYLLWAAVLYAGLGTWCTFKIGKPLPGLNVKRQRHEADFRFSLIRFRQNAEHVAFYGGEQTERGIFRDRFKMIFQSIQEIMKRQRVLSCFTLGYTQIAVIFPLIVVSPRYFARQIGWGGLMQIVNAFSFVQNSLSFIVNSYPDIASLEAATQRLNDFEARLRDHRNTGTQRQKIQIQQIRSGIAVKHLDLNLPDGTPLLRDICFHTPPGEALLITGPSGTGKSTLLRALAGIWPHGQGNISLGQGRSLFLPQRPYLPLGTLTKALLYPCLNAHTPKNLHLAAILEMVRLETFIDQLDQVDNWSDRLSPGEQQRLTFARIFLTQPSILFMDEATSALDEGSEAYLLGLLRSTIWCPTIVSVGHRSTLRSFHDRFVDIASFSPKHEIQSLTHSIFEEMPPNFIGPRSQAL
jgi:vitamin B12/bleomycin/antimicrobial peptide transport system ATP-binding/permease protein